MDKVDIADVSAGSSWKYQFGKLLFATVVAFAATKLAEKTFDASAVALQNRAISNTEG